MSRRMLARVVVYGALIAGFAVAAFDMLQLRIWDSVRMVPIRVTAPTAVRSVVQTKWGFPSESDAADWTWSNEFEQHGMLRNVSAGTKEGFTLDVGTSGRRSGLGLWSDTYEFSRHWVVFVHLEDGTSWAAVVNLPDDLRDRTSPDLQLTIPANARKLDVMPEIFIPARPTALEAL